MSEARSRLSALGIEHGWRPLSWHYALADQIGANAVQNIFRYGTLTVDPDGFHCIILPSALVEKIGKWRQEVEGVLAQMTENAKRDSQSHVKRSAATV
jgi:hypothetical protein